MYNVAGRLRSLARAAHGTVQLAPAGQRRARIGVLRHLLTAAFDEMAAAGAGAAAVVDVPRAVTGGAGWQALGVVDLALGQTAFPSMCMASRLFAGSL